MISLPALTSSGAALFAPWMTLLFGNRTISAQAAAALPPVVVGPGRHASRRMTISDDIARLLGSPGDGTGSPPGSPDGAADATFSFFAAPESARQRRAAAPSATPAAPAATAPAAPPATVPADTVDTARYRAMSVDDLLGEIAHCAAAFGPGDCTHLSPHGATASHERLKGMVAALQALPERRCDLAQLQNAYFALRRSFQRMRHLVREIHVGQPDLGPLLPAWAADMAARAIRQARALSLEPALRDLDDPLRYAPVVPEVAQPMAFHVANLRRRHAEAGIVRAGQEIDRLFDEIYAPGNRLVEGASVQEYVPRDAYFNRLIRGVVVVCCDVRELPRILRCIPGAQLRAGGPQPGGQRATYPAASGIMRVVWQRPSGAETTVLVHAGTGAGPRYSLDGGRTWQPTGAPGSTQLEARRSRHWGRFIEHRRQDMTEPYWKLIQRGPFAVRAANASSTQAL